MHVPYFQLPWFTMPTCAFPERLQGVPLASLDLMTLEWCLNEPLSESTSALEIIKQGLPIFWSIIIGCAAMCLALTFFIVMRVILTRHRAKYYTHEDNMSELKRKTMK